MGKIGNKNKSLFRSKTQMIIYIFLFIILLYLFVVLGNIDYTKEENDHDKFANDYKIVEKDNVYKYTNHSEAYNIVNGKKGILLFGHTNNKWVSHYAKIVNDVAKEVGINEINYYDFLDDRKIKNGTYEAIVKLLNNYVIFDDLGHADIYAPTLVVVLNGSVLYYDDDTALIKGSITPETYWNEYNTGLKKSELKVVFEQYLNGDANGK